MKKIIPGLIKYPVDAQRSSLFCALSAIYIYLEDYTEDTPYFCSHRQRYCIHCGNCKAEPFINKHHLQIYQYLLTISGSAYFWEDSAIGDPYLQKYKKGDLSIKALDRLDLALQATSYNYETVDHLSEQSILFARVKQSVDDNMPALIKIGGGDVWAVIAGYDDIKELPILQKMNHSPAPNKEWYEKLRNIVFITGKNDKNITLSDFLLNMKAHLSAKYRNDLENKIINQIESEQDGKKLGMWLNKINGLTIETRWHASECYRSTLACMTENQSCINLLNKASELHLKFHDQAWKVWGALGVTPQTGYTVPKNVHELLQVSSTRTELKNLFKELFSLDRMVLNYIEESLTLMQ